MPSGLSPERVAFLDRHLTARIADEDHALAGGWLHFCDEWDLMLIDQTDPEFEVCGCTFSHEFDKATGKRKLAS